MYFSIALKVFYVHRLCTHIIDISIMINNIMFKNKLLVERFELLIGVFKS